MTRKLHPYARTKAALRREIQESSETNKALAARLGFFAFSFNVGLNDRTCLLQEEAR